jgi:hypothetical protein
MRARMVRAFDFRRKPMSWNRRRILLPILACLCLVLAGQASWAQAPVAKCGARPLSTAQDNAVQQSTPAADPLSDLFTPSPIFKSIVGDCCTSGRANCPPIPGRRVVGCGGDCDGFGHIACLYL